MPSPISSMFLLLLLIRPVLAMSGLPSVLCSLFRCLQTAPASLGVAQYHWPVPGTTLLSDELSLLHRPKQIASSVFASILTSTWNRTAFGP
jgi:hypothetical protein